MEVVEGATTETKKRGRPKGSTSSRREDNKPQGFACSPQNMSYLMTYQEETNHSMSHLINLAIDHVRMGDLFSSLEVKVPKAVLRAQAVMELWAKQNARNKKK